MGREREIKGREIKVSIFIIVFLVVFTAVAAPANVIVLLIPVIFMQ